MSENIFNKNKYKEKTVRIIDLSEYKALDSFMSNDFYCTTELPE